MQSALTQAISLFRPRGYNLDTWQRITHTHTHIWINTMLLIFSLRSEIQYNMTESYNITCCSLVSMYLANFLYYFFFFFPIIQVISFTMVDRTAHMELCYRNCKKEIRTPPPCSACSKVPGETFNYPFQRTPFNEEISCGRCDVENNYKFPVVNFERCAENRLPNGERQSWKKREISDVSFIHRYETRKNITEIFRGRILISCFLSSPHVPNKISHAMSECKLRAKENALR